MKDGCWHPRTVFLQKTNGFDAAQPVEAQRPVALHMVLQCTLGGFGGHSAALAPASPADASWPHTPGPLEAAPGLCTAPRIPRHFLAFPASLLSCSFVTATPLHTPVFQLVLVAPPPTSSLKGALRLHTLGAPETLAACGTGARCIPSGRRCRSVTRARFGVGVHAQQHSHR